MIHLSEKAVCYLGDCLGLMPKLGENVFDAIVTDPPYGLSFMGKAWDHGVPGVPFWEAALRVLKPGGHMLAFGGTRTFHRLAVAIEDAGFEIRDTLMWVYGTGFPKSLDVSKAIDKAAGAERDKVPPRSVIGHQRNIGNRRPYMDDPDHMTDSDTPASAAAAAWQGWGTALKPAYEPIILARKPLDGTVAENVLRWGTGALNIDGCRVEGAFTSGWSKSGSKASENVAMNGANYARDPTPDNPAGRWPANLIHDGSDEVLAAFPVDGKTASGVAKVSAGGMNRQVSGSLHAGSGMNVVGKVNVGVRDHGDAGSAARFFYCAKAGAKDRAGSKHPTVKPLALMRYLCRLITPPGGVILDPFAGSGTTGQAAVAEGFDVVMIEQTPQSVDDIKRRFA